ncbi:MAG: T9SS type A sorting domain-containing protein, partial [Bacteroidota bacterium]
GEVTVRISQPGNDEYNPAETVTHTFVVVKPSEVENPLGTDAQNIVYNTPSNRTFGDSPFPLEVESSSKLPVSYEIEGPATISNGIVTILGAGEVTIRAFQTGNEEYAPSDTVELTFTVNKATQTIDLEVISIDNNTFQIQTNSDADLPVVVTVSEGEGIIEGDILTVTSPSATLTATQGGNENYTAAEPVSKEVSVEVITSVSDDLEESGIVVYPNPSAGLFKVRRLTNGQQPLPYQIFDLRGALVVQGKLNSQQTNIDLTNHRGGTYILQLHLTDNTKQYRIVKQ